MNGIARIFASVSGVLLLSLIPSAFIHAYASRIVVVRDVLIIVCAFVGLLALAKETFWTHWPVWGTSITYAWFIGPLLFCSKDLQHVLIVYKWVAIWILAYVTGTLVRRLNSRRIAGGILCIFITLLLVDLGIGICEGLSQSYWLPVDSGIETQSGKDVYRLHSLGETIRVKGFNRESAEYSNLLSSGAIVCAAIALHSRAGPRVCLGLLAIVFTAGSVFSGTRSQLIGSAFALCCGFFWMMLPRSRPLLSLTTARVLMATFAVVLHLVNFQQLVTELGAFFFGSSPYGDSTSTEMRIELWLGTVRLLAGSDVQLVMGLGWANFFGSTSLSDIAIVDNQYIWSLYHLGVIGSLCAIIPLVCSVNPAVSSRRVYVFLYLLLIASAFGEGVGKDVLFYYSSAVLMFSIGMAREDSRISRATITQCRN